MRKLHLSPGVPGLQLAVRLQRVANAGTVYAIGGVASLWVVERVAGFW